jgi:hypothetical protein
MQSLPARLPKRRPALVAICGLLFAAAAVPVALAAAPKPRTGSYSGTARHIANGTFAGSAKIKLSGKVVSSTKATGTASFSKAKQSGCPGKAFTATESKT